MVESETKMLKSFNFRSFSEETSHFRVSYQDAMFFFLEQLLTFRDISFFDSDSKNIWRDPYAKSTWARIGEELFVNIRKLYERTSQNLNMKKFATWSDPIEFDYRANINLELSSNYSYSYVTLFVQENKNESINYNKNKFPILYSLIKWYVIAWCSLIILETKTTLWSWPSHQPNSMITI